MTLRSKTLSPLALLSALFFLFLYVYWFPRSTLNLERQELSATRRHLESVAEGLVPLLLAHQVDAVYENLDALLEQNEAWVGIRLVDAEGRPIYPLQDAVPGGPPRGGARVVGHELRFLGHDLGKLELTVDISSITAAAEARHRQLVTALLVVLCGYLLGIGVVVERIVRRPVHVLAHAAERVAHGDFDVPLVKMGDDEVGTLVDSFARMRDAIRDYQANLLASNRAISRLSRAVEQSPVSVMITDTEGRLTFVNPKFSQITGYGPEEVLGRNPRFLKSGKTTAAEYESLWRTIASGGTWRGELCNKRKNGELYWESASISPIVDEHAAIVSYLAVKEDVTERKRADETLRRLNRELRAISDCDDVLVRAEDERRLLDDVCRIICEGAGYRMAWVGYAEHDEARTVRPVAWAGVEDGYLASAAIVWSDTERGRGPSGTAIRSGATTCFQDFTADPQAAPWRESALLRGYRSSIAVPLADEAGGTFGALCIYSAEPNAFTPDEMRLMEQLAGDLAFGITVLRARAERRRVEEQIRQLNEELEGRIAESILELETANREQDAFAYSVSHDLRAPLRHIAGFAGLLRKRMEGVSDEQSQHYLASIFDAAERMGQLIDDLLTYSRMGREEISPTRVDLDEVLQDVIRELEPELKGRAVRWRVAALPVVRGDRAMLHVVLANLVSNALKFTRPRAEAEIEVGCHLQEAEAVVFVRDNGVGFDPRYSEKLFGVFRRLHRAEEFGGTGIGLANVRRIIGRHGGRTWAEGRVGQGATFYFSLPREAREGEEREAGEERG